MTQRTRDRLILVGAGVILYIVFCPLRGSVELLISRAWLLPSTQMPAQIPPQTKEDATGLYNGNSLVFVSDDGKHSLFAEGASDASIGNGVFARMEADATEVRDTSGASVAELPRAYPFYSGSFLYLISLQGNAVSQYGKNLKEAWKYEAGEAVTGLCADAAGDTFIGLSNGHVIWLDPQGRVLLDTIPGEGSIHVIYSLQWIERDKTLVVLADQGPQEILFLHPEARKSGADLSEFDSIEVKPASRKPLFMQSALRDRYLLIERPSGMEAYDRLRRSGTLLEDDGSFARAVDLPSPGLLVFALNHGTESEILGMKPDGRVLFRQSLPGNVDDLAVDSKEKLIISSPGALLAMDFYAR